MKKTIKQQREEWLKERKKGIGGSDASAILGMNPYKTNRELWEEKTGRRAANYISSKAHVEYGQKAENPLIELFKLDYPEYKVTTKPFEIKTHKEHSFIIGTLDSELVEKSSGAKGVLEIKTTELLSSMHKEKWNDQIPQNYYIQILHYLLVTGFDFVILKAHIRTKFDGNVQITTKHYYFDRKDVEEDLQYLLSEEVKFWNEYVLKDKEPPLRLPGL